MAWSGEAWTSDGAADVGGVCLEGPSTTIDATNALAVSAQTIVQRMAFLRRFDERCFERLRVAPETNIASERAMDVPVFCPALRSLSGGQTPW